MPLRLSHHTLHTPFQHPFTTAHGTKTHQPALVVSLGLGPLVGWGEAPAIHYYGVSVEGMIEALEAKRPLIERYALTDPERFWHFLHHLLPGQNFLIAALDIAGWDLFAQLRRQPLGHLLGLDPATAPITDYTLGFDTAEEVLCKADARPWPVYKLKIPRPDDVDLILHLRAHLSATHPGGAVIPFRVDANEGWNEADTRRLLPELQALGVEILEQPLPRDAWEDMAALKEASPVPLFADESCVVEGDVARCEAGFGGIVIKLTKCGGITPARRMIADAHARGLRVMLGAMNETGIGTAALAHLAPAANLLDADGPLLLAADPTTGLPLRGCRWAPPQRPGLGVALRA